MGCRGDFQGGTIVTYTIGCRWIDYCREQFTVQKATAKEALTEADSLQRCDVQIEYIDTPEDGRVDMMMLRVLAEKEGHP
jgi:hypothetical protein